MSTDDGGLTDEVIAEVNPEPEPDAAREARLAQQEPPLSSRPADSAAKGDWVDYCVALGADRHFIMHDTEHWEGDKDTGQRVTAKALTKAELIELADRRGG